MLILISKNIQDTVFDLMHVEPFQFPYGSFGQMAIIFGADVSTSVHVYDKKNYILILGEG